MVLLSKEERVISYLPKKIIHDRGEFKRFNIPNLINNLYVLMRNIHNIEVMKKMSLIYFYY